MASTYSFKDLSMVISHPSYGSYSIQGEGIGEVTFTKTTDRSVQDVAADGSVMTSKIEGNNGSVVINAQQTSGLHKFLQGLVNYLISASSDEWAQISITAESSHMGKKHYCTGGAPLKDSDNPYQAQGQRVSWTMLFADIQNIQT